MCNYFECKIFLPSVTQKIQQTTTCFSYLRRSASWERKTCIGCYLRITSVESVTNKYICVCVCVSHDASIKLQKQDTEEGKWMKDEPKVSNSEYPLMDDDMQEQVESPENHGSFDLRRDIHS